MIAFLQGRLAEVGEDAVVIGVGGVGYRVLIPVSTLVRLPAPGEEIKLFTQLQVREDAFVLYGFATQAEQEIFVLLQTIPGVGPKVSLSVLSVCTPQQLRQAIVGEDYDALTRVPGIGKKTAQRMVLELKEKIGKVLPLGSEERTGFANVDEAAAALTVLGYGAAEVDMALRFARESGGAARKTEDLVRQALRYLRDR